MFDRVAECGARHRCSVAIEKVSQARLVPLANFSNPATNRLLDQVFGVVRENLSDAEGVISKSSRRKLQPSLWPKCDRAQ